MRRPTMTRRSRRQERADGLPRHRSGRLILAAAAAASLAAAAAQAGPALAAPAKAGTASTAAVASTAAAASTAPGWTTVTWHGHGIRVHPHGRFGVVHQTGRQAARQQPPAGSNLIYNGGPVARAPTVYLDFWGSQ